jgi:hypothetical protein
MTRRQIAESLHEGSEADQTHRRSLASNLGRSYPDLGLASDHVRPLRPRTDRCISGVPLRSPFTTEGAFVQPNGSHPHCEADSDACSVACHRSKCETRRNPPRAEGAGCKGG